MACGYEDLDGTAEECDDGPTAALTIIYLGEPWTVEVCATHTARYHRMLRPFKFNARPVNTTQPDAESGWRDAWGQRWVAREVRFWLKEFARIEVSDRARFHPERHMEPWKRASEADITLLRQVQAAMKAAKKESARERFAAGDPYVQALVKGRVDHRRADRNSDTQ